MPTYGNRGPKNRDFSRASVQAELAGALTSNRLLDDEALGAGGTARHPATSGERLRGLDDQIANHQDRNARLVGCERWVRPRETATTIAFVESAGPREAATPCS